MIQCLWGGLIPNVRQYHLGWVGELNLKLDSDVVKAIRRGAYSSPLKISEGLYLIVRDL